MSAAIIIGAYLVGLLVGHLVTRHAVARAMRSDFPASWSSRRRARRNRADLREALRR